ncbi:T9SS type A sorting domain-containing protein [Rhizosphaericola mali]|uniref:T9SS type A sorting domain-containing protein n=1 Tax=Rhizosphaericola mali TaxID=2545455 RepID=A0A5P2G750_9BACT|nr:T9SS type A sorting domain-containing protein [Rhizosphaericola mali]QES89053.1 T9SS type A sorting domain-containing protein [Rhizosphaericola mali]
MIRLLPRCFIIALFLLIIGLFPSFNANGRFAIGQSIHSDTISLFNLYGKNLENIDVKKFVSKLYPNPASNYVIIEFDRTLPTNTHLLVYSFTGSKMADIMISNLKVDLNLSNYYRGLYLYQLIATTGKILESGKFQVIK